MLKRLGPPDGPWGTVNVVALDRHGDLCSGAEHERLSVEAPGRIGDSPLVGAGNYCDNAAGAAACTGRGELAIGAARHGQRSGSSRPGAEPEAACLAALRDAASLPDEFRAPLTSSLSRRTGATERPPPTRARPTPS